ncbi:MAG: diguanylate cyclase [Thermoanaerobacteraceae bacterium]|jgi:hypothetical protein|nr:diguanylate cyclase [Thermoanaerobacteraceae bacterium]
MKEKMYKYAPAILLTVGLILWLPTLLIDSCYNHNKSWVWLPFVIQNVLNIICGIFMDIKLRHDDHRPVFEAFQ